MELVMVKISEEPKTRDPVAQANTRMYLRQQNFCSYYPKWMEVSLDYGEVRMAAFSPQWVWQEIQKSLRLAWTFMACTIGHLMPRMLPMPGGLLRMKWTSPLSHLPLLIYQSGQHRC